MPNWKALLDEVKAAAPVYDVVRRNYLRQLFEHTDRNVIVYYSGWLQKGNLPGLGATTFSINDSDKNGFMATIHQLDKKKGLDLLLHTPGGDIAATESLVDYLRSMFGTNIRAVVPQLAMSAGTMVSLACKQIVMGKHSSLGPIDPQIGGIPAHGVIEEFNEAAKDIVADPRRAHLWQPIIAKYSPTLIGRCNKAIDWSTQIVKEWLITGMFDGQVDAKKKANHIVKELGSHALTKSHARHISSKKAQELGLDVVPLENDQKLQDLVLTVHHACIQSLSGTPALKIIENHLGVAFIENAVQQ
ncbi:MAG: hypothetical protein WCD76_05515 [Pyrinomonadaceae bacterium]